MEQKTWLMETEGYERGGEAGPAAMVWPVRPWLYWFLREKNGVAWILTHACVIEWPLQAGSLGRQRGLF